MEDKEIKATNSNGDWSDDYQGDAPLNSSKYFSDKLLEGDLSFKTEITFKDEGVKETTKTPWGEKKVITFQIEHEGKEKIMQVGVNQFDYLKAITEAKPVMGKKAIVQRTGTTQKDTKRTIKFL